MIVVWLLLLIFRYWYDSSIAAVYVYVCLMIVSKKQSAGMVQLQNSDYKTILDHQATKVLITKTIKHQSNQ